MMLPSIPRCSRLNYSLGILRQMLTSSNSRMIPIAFYSGSAGSPDLMAKFKEDMKAAMKSKDKDRAQVIKSFISDVTYSEKGANQAQSVVAVLRKAIAKRRDSEKAFKDGGREDLALKEAQMADILASYLPQQMTEAALTKIIQDTIKDMALTSTKDLGKLMKELGVKLDESVAPKQTVAQLAKKLISSL